MLEKSVIDQYINNHPSHHAAPVQMRRYILDHFWSEGYIDDHNGRSYSAKEIDPRLKKLGIWTNFRSIQIVPVYEGIAYYSINPLYVGHDGRIHLDTCSCGGAVPNCDLEKFNREHSPNQKVEGYISREFVIAFTKEGWDSVKNSGIFYIPEEV